MLGQISIRDIVLIDRLDLDFSPGLTVLTGETGAGKSILLDALSLALGARGDGSLVRHGAEQGQVVAAFHLPAGHPVEALLADNGIDIEDTLILRRVQSADGRSRGSVNDQPASIGLMRQIGMALVEIHGQHDARALVDAATHRALLDAFAGLDGKVGEVAALWRALGEVERRHKAFAARVEDAARETEYLQAAVAELGKLAPAAGEEEALAERRQTMMAAEKIAGDLNEAFEVLSGNGSPVPALAGAVRRLERKSAQAPKLTATAIAAFDRALIALDEAHVALEAAIREAAFDPGELERVEERLFALRAAARKYKVPVDGLAELAGRLQRDLAEIDAGEERLAALVAEVAAARDAYFAAARALSEARQAAARRIETAVDAELPDLKLERAAFLVDLVTDEGAAGPDGIDRVEFWVRTNPGTRPGPMMKVASGGELARFLLALKVVLAERGSAPTLVFDEIDTGLGGAVAEAIGVRLARLAEKVQVLAVTHAPQVAARADHHLRITKAPRDGGERVATAVEIVSGEHRREEIARMLAGATISDEARAAADKLIGGGRR